MEPFEYVIMVPSLIIGLGIAQILTNVADIVSNLRNVKVSLHHSLIVYIVFIYFIQDWWYNFQYSQLVTEWTVSIVFFLLLYPIALYLLSRMLFPTGWRGHETDLDEYYFDQWPWLYSVFAFVPLISALQNVTLSGYGLEDQIIQFTYFVLLVFFVVFRIQTRLAHTIFLLIQALAATAWIFLDDYVLIG